jgi:protein ImuB
MEKRFMSIWFRHLLTDWQANRRGELRELPFVFAAKARNRIIITAANIYAEQQGATIGMAAADAKAIVPGLQVLDEIPGKAAALLNAIGEWCIRFAPIVAVDMPDGLILDISGCPHLWGGEREYLKDIHAKLKERGYDTRIAIADTIGAAWATARFGKLTPIIAPGGQVEALLNLPPAALRLEPVILDRLQKLGFYKINRLVGIGRSALRRRFGQAILQRLDQAVGNELESIIPIQPITPFVERLPCLEPIMTATGIEIAIQRLLDILCRRLEQEGQGLRVAILKCYRIDGKLVQVEIGTTRASRSTRHLFKLFELKIVTIEPALGIELFVLEAPKVEDLSAEQEALWATEDRGLEGPAVSELLDRIAGKLGADTIHRYLPQEHYWPERSVKSSLILSDKPVTDWRTNRPRPVQLLEKPEHIDVMVPIPDYPPAQFIYKRQIHQVRKADGPERIEREWWLEAGELRDYYTVEDQDGHRYWLFRSGHYSGEQPVQWFIHGFLA